MSCLPEVHPGLMANNRDNFILITVLFKTTYKYASFEGEVHM